MERDGFELYVSTWPDDSSPRDADCYSAEDIAAWEANEWFYVAVRVEAFAEGVELGSAELGAYESGRFGGKWLTPETDAEIVNPIADEAVADARATLAKLKGL